MLNRLYPIFTDSNLGKNEFPFHKRFGAMLNSEYSIDGRKLCSAILKLAIKIMLNIYRPFWSVKYLGQKKNPFEKGR